LNRSGEPLRHPKALSSRLANPAFRNMKTVKTGAEETLSGLSNESRLVNVGLVPSFSKDISPRLSIFSLPNDYRMNDSRG